MLISFFLSSFFFIQHRFFSLSPSLFPRKTMTFLFCTIHIAFLRSVFYRSFSSLSLSFSLPSVSLTRLAFVTTSLSPCFIYTSNVSSLCHSYMFFVLDAHSPSSVCSFEAASSFFSCRREKNRSREDFAPARILFYSLAIHSRSACCKGTDMYCP